MSILTSAKLAAGSGAAKMAAKVEAKAQAAKAAAEASAAKAKAQAEAAAAKKAAEAAAKQKAKLDKALAAATARLDKAKGQRDALTDFINKLQAKIQSRDLKEYMSFGTPRRKRRITKNKKSGLTLKQLQVLARRNKVSIYKIRKDRRGYTKKPLTKKALKARLSRARVSYKNRTRKSYVSRSPIRNKRLNLLRGCPVGEYKDPLSGICKTIPKYEDLDELDSVNFDWSSNRTFSNRPLSMQMYGRSCFGAVPPPCDCGL